MGYRIAQADGLHVVYENGDPDKWLATFKELEHAEGFKAWLTSQPQPTGPTVRCRIAVGIDSDGEWGAYGGNEFDSDDDLRRDIADQCSRYPWQVIHIIEAEVPLPQRVEPAVIQGRVVEGEKG